MVPASSACLRAVSSGMIWKISVLDLAFVPQ